MTRPDPLGVLASSEDGRVERPVVTPPWPVATDLRLVGGDRLQWRPGRSEAQWVEPSPGLLEEFVNLREGSPAAVLRYARRWGVLYLCEHDFPAGHPFVDYWPGRPIEAHPCPFDENERLTPEALEWDRYRERLDRYIIRRDKYLVENGSLKGFEEKPKAPPLDQFPPRGDFHFCYPRGFQVDMPWEPVSSWRMWAGRAYALLSITAALRQGEEWTEEDWRVASGSEGWLSPATPADCWHQVGYFSNLWLGAARVRPWIVPGNGTTQLALGSGGGNSPLFGAIAVQLALAVCGAEGFAVCDGCKNPHAPSRKPRSGERTYCKRCRREGVPQKHASADSRARKKGKRLRAR
jgi:hypothetical protein